MPAFVLSIQTGPARDLGDPHATDPLDRPWTSGIFKQPVAGPVRLTRTGFEGDVQADPVHHGGPDKAVLAYSADHFVAWRTELQRPELGPGGFGENLSVVGLAEPDVCIGDVWKIGNETVVEVSQPRQPCWKLARRWRLKQLPLLVQDTGRTGWYLRVLQEGVVEAGMEWSLLRRPAPDWSVARANRILHVDRQDRAGAAGLAALPALAASWKTPLQSRLADAPPRTP